MTDKFQYIARKIVNDSIRNAVYVDDAILEPFDEQIEGDPPVRALCKGVYDSFRKRNCALDFYKFRSRENVAQNLELFFKRKDLLILDWELTQTQSQNETLFLIDQAIHTDSLHFICIFTATPQKDYPDILYNISGYFSGITLKNATDFYNMITGIAETGVEIEKTLEFLKGLLKELALKPEGKKRQISHEIAQKLTQELGSDFEEFNHNLQLIFPGKLPDSFERIGYLLNGAYLKESPDKPVERTIFDSQNFIRINHTLILIIGKSDINEDQGLFERFTDALLTYQGNFLTVMGLEFRNAFLEQSGFVGKDLDKIDEKALFHHMNHADPTDEFYDFLKDLWKTTVFDPIIRKDFDIFSILNEYQDARYSEPIIPNNNDLGHLNFYYNKSPVARKPNAKISFGDIFRLSGNGRLAGHYLICITPLCDCVRPAKVDNMLYFVKGEKGNLAKGIKRGDTGHDSYIIDSENIICVQWQPKPFTIYINEEANSISSPIEAQIGDTKYILQYIESIRENYTQRIANQAFSYPLRVGIYFVNNKEETPDDSN